MIAYRLLIENADRAARVRSASPGSGALVGLPPQDAFSLPPERRSTYLAALGHVVSDVRDALGLPAA